MNLRSVGRMTMWLGATAGLLYLALLSALFAEQSRILYPGWSRGVRAIGYDAVRFRRVEKVIEDGFAPGVGHEIAWTPAAQGVVAG